MPYKDKAIARVKSAERMKKMRGRRNKGVTGVTKLAGATGVTKGMGVTASGIQGVTKLDVTPKPNHVGQAKPCPLCQAPSGHITGFCHL